MLDLAGRSYVPARLRLLLEKPLDNIARVATIVGPPQGMDEWTPAAMARK